MTPPILSVKEEGKANISLVSSSTSIDSVSWNNSGLKERNYLGLSDCSSVDSSAVPGLSDNNDKNFILKATELKLGLPGSLSPKRDPESSLLGSTKLDEKIVFPLLPSKGGVCSSSLKTVASGNKRGFSDTVDGFSEVKGSSFTEGNWVFSAAVRESEATPTVQQGKFAGNGVTNVVMSSISSENQPTIMKEVSQKASHEQNHSTIGSNQSTKNGPNNNRGIPAAKAQVVGWPPIRSFRKNTVAAPSKDNEEVDGKPGPGSLYVKVSMDGAPYLRKVDLRTYSTYQELSSALKKMFGYFTTGQGGSQGTLGREMLGEIKSRDLLHGSEFFLTYEDKDGDWMLVGDVPWEMFIESCKRLKIVKGFDAIGLAPRTTEKSKNWN